MQCLAAYASACSPVSVRSYGVPPVGIAVTHTLVLPRSSPGDLGRITASRVCFALTVALPWAIGTTSAASALGMITRGVVFHLLYNVTFSVPCKALHYMTLSYADAYMYIV